MGSVCRAGLITSASADAYQWGGAQQSCQTGTLATAAAFCSASVGYWAASNGLATSSYGSVAAYIQGGVATVGYGASAMASAGFSDELTIFGGVGQGVLDMLESSLEYGTGILQNGSPGVVPVTSTFSQTFTYGTPFTISLSASASGLFDGGDGGSLLVEKTLQSMTVEGARSELLTYTDQSGHVYSIEDAAFTATPEPGAWTLVAIGLGLLVVGRRKGNRA